MTRVLLVVALMSTVFVGCNSNEESTVTGSPSPAAAAAPTLKIISPKAGDTITNPMKVTYEATGFEVGSPPKGHFHAIWGTGANDYIAFTVAKSNSGTVTATKSVPASVTEITFQLAQANHSLLKNAEAKVVVKNLTVKGSASTTGGGGY